LPVRKSYTVNEHVKPFDELNDEFQKRFRLYHTPATYFQRELPSLYYKLITPTAIMLFMQTVIH